MRAAGISIVVTLAFAAALASHALAQPVPRDTQPQLARPVALSAADVTRLGIRVAPLKPASYTPRMHGYGVVVDLGALATADAAISTAEAASRQTSADYKRAQALYAQRGAISKQALDAAEHQATSDGAALLLAQRQEIVQFGAHVPWRGDHADRSLLMQLTSGRSILVKVTFPLDALNATHPQSISITRLGAREDQGGWTATKVWSAPADPTIPGSAFFAVITGSDLQSGDHTLAYAPVGQTLQGLRVPSAAVLFSNEKTWCYLQVAPDTFARLPVDLNHPLSDGYFVSAKAAFGKSVVVNGGGLLLAREFGASLLSRD